jgi:hypothetical protein
MPGLNVFRLSPPDSVVGNAGVIARALFGMSGPIDGPRTLEMSAISGCWDYSDRTHLWQSTSSDEGSADQARRAADGFLAASRQKLAGVKGEGDLVLTSLLPTELRVISVAPAHLPGATSADHWVVRYGVSVPTGAMAARGVSLPDTPNRPTAPTPPAQPDPTSGRSPEPATPPEPDPPSAPVAGATVDVRVTAGGLICAVSSRWRPIQSVEIASRLPAPSVVESGRQLLVYLAGGPSEPLIYLAPYWRATGDEPDEGTLSPATRHSLSIEVSRSDNGAGVTLAATVTGNTGTVRHAWGRWSLASDLGTAEVLGEGPQVSLPPGVHNVVLDVEDTVTRAFRRVEVLVFAGAAESKKGELIA